ncbi:MAG: GNAT family N-acetyltransferase [Chitinophagaceae bacterium]|nr:MAG: GNAT family N-acetyltransferase [Chitinophagaceae bacterium]
MDPIGVPRSYINPENEASDTLIGAFWAESLLGCCILTKVDAATVQLRQMAVDTSQQQAGVGRRLLAFAEGIAIKQGYSTLKLHARDTVIPFYQKCGYAPVGEPFFEVGIAHQVMQKNLSAAVEKSV